MHKITTNLTFERYIKFNSEFFRKSGIFYFCIFYEIFLILIGILFKKFAYILIAILFFVLIAIFRNLNVKKFYKSNKTIQDAKMTFEFFDTYFVVKTEDSEGKYKYDKLYKIKELKNYFFLSIGKNQGYVLPKEDMTSELKNFIRNIKI